MDQQGVAQAEDPQEDSAHGQVHAAQTELPGEHLEGDPQLAPGGRRLQDLRGGLAAEGWELPRGCQSEGPRSRPAGGSSGEPAALTRL